MARSVPWPMPVSASDPYSRTAISCVSERRPSRSSPSTKSCAARIGPMVCELDGPTPILKMSNTLKVMLETHSCVGERQQARIAAYGCGIDADRLLRCKAGKIVRATRLRTRARKTAAAKGLHAYDGADHIPIDVDIPDAC